ncbi:plasma membrane proteolipid Pmp3 [Meyerozyma guilliermondii]
MDADKIVALIIALFLPPLAVFMKEGATTPLWIDIVLCIFFWFPGILYAIYVVLKD